MVSRPLYPVFLFKWSVDATLCYATSHFPVSEYRLIKDIPIMSEFVFYLQQGALHITDLKGIDHMVFIITLCAVYQVENWKKVFILVTAFTLGHSLTLVLSALDVIRVSSQLVETLIPVTILITSILNVSRISLSTKKEANSYVLALLFGLIHGMGFSNYFRAMMAGIDDAILFPLFSFNLGIELGQLLIVSIFLLILFLLTRALKINHAVWSQYISGAGGGIAIVMIINTLFT